MTTDVREQRSATGVVRFSWQDMQLFTTASRDHNPLHVDHAYSHRSPYGEPIVYGVLATLAGVGTLDPRAGAHVARLVMDFPGALFCDIDYRAVVIDSSDDLVTVALHDGSKAVLRVTVTFASGIPRSGGVFCDGLSVRQDAADYTLDDLEPGATTRFRYAPQRAAARELMERYGLVDRGLGDYQVAGLLCASYLAGMELPGRRGLCSRIIVEVDQAPAGDGVLDVDARVTKAHPRVNAVDIAADLRQRNKHVATVGVRGFVRPDPLTMRADEARALLPPTDALSARAALVIGGSRGLGAALVRALASQGATVFCNYRYAHAEADAVRREAENMGRRVHLVAGDGADPSWCAAARDTIAERVGGLDILACVAAPPLRPLPVDPVGVDRIVDYVAGSIALVAAPLTTFVNEIDDRSGAVVVVSASAVDEPPREWLHYAAAKRAVEGLATAAVAGRSRTHLMITRAPPMATDFSNLPTAVGRTPPERISAAIVGQLTAALGADVKSQLSHDQHGIAPPDTAV